MPSLLTLSDSGNAIMLLGRPSAPYESPQIQRRSCFGWVGNAGLCYPRSAPPAGGDGPELRFTAEHMRRALAMLTRALGGFGCAVRAVVFVLAGAVLSSAKQTKGLDAIFRSVAGSAGGSWLLALLASGLLCYGLYCLIEARYRDLTPGR